MGFGSENEYLMEVTLGLHGEDLYEGASMVAWALNW